MKDAVQERLTKKVHRTPGPSLFEREYLRQLVNEIQTVLKGHEVSTFEEIVLGVKGHGYHTIIDLKKEVEG